MKYDNKQFEVKLDVNAYTPEELSVKIVDNELVITGSHQQKADKYGFVTREFTRQFAVPEVSI